MLMNDFHYKINNLKKPGADVNEYVDVESYV